MKKNKVSVDLNPIIVAETRWHELYAEICAAQRKMRDSAEKVEVDGVIHVRMSEDDHKKLLSALIQFTSMSNILMEWGDELKTSPAVSWAKDILSKMIGLKDSDALDQMVKEKMKEHE